MPYATYFTYRLKSDTKTSKEMHVIGTGFQHVIDSYFWFLPFASARQCKYVMERAKIPDDEWMTKRDSLAEEHNTPGARDSLKAGFEAWLQSDLFTQRRSKMVPVPANTQPMILAD